MGTDEKKKKPRDVKTGNAALSSKRPLPGKFQLLIDCRDEAEQRKLFEELTARNIACRVRVI